MAGDWIKMRSNLWDDPRIARVCDLLDCTEASVVGGLYWLWATADQHTEDGVMPGLTLRQIDRKTGIPGFGQALCDIGWLADHPEGIRITRFEEHNGVSAKRRCSDAQRKAAVRNVSASDADNVRTDDGQDTDEKRRSAELEKEKRREEKKPTVSARGTRLPNDWDPGEEGYAFAAEHGLLNGRAVSELAKFRDFWASKPGASGSKADWHATWRNWVRKATERTGPPEPGTKGKWV